MAVHSKVKKQSFPSKVGGTLDLRALYKATGGPGRAGKLVAPSPVRPMWRGPVVSGSLPSGPVGPFAGPPAVFVDGCQAGQVIKVGSERRPVMLLWAAATSYEPRERRTGPLEERLWITCSDVDVQMAEELPGGLEVIGVKSLYPRDIRADAIALLQDVRAQLELDVIVDTDTCGGLFMIDGSLPNLGAAEASGQIGVIKSHGCRFLADERVLYDMPEGYTSASFVLLPRNVEESARHSCYLRLRAPDRDDWMHGLIRLEARSDEDLMAGAAGAFAWRQSTASTDVRWDRQLGGTYLVERLLKSRKPAYI